MTPDDLTQPLLAIIGQMTVELASCRARVRELEAQQTPDPAPVED